METQLEALYQQHLDALANQWHTALADNQQDAAILWAGHTENFLFDDQGPMFRANPHLLHWFPHTDCEHAALLVRPGQQAKLYLWQPEDYWHLPPAIPGWCAAHFDVQTYPTVEALEQAVASDSAGTNRLACIGSQQDGQDFQEQHAAHATVNPSSLMHQLDYHRAYKSPFELACMRSSTAAAVAGHQAAQTAFNNKQSEFQINLAYLAASAQSALDLPYGNIVGLNEHAGVLHYQHQTHDVPQPYLSLLIDAGARAFGYASDITRTYSAQPGLFGDLIKSLDAAQLALIATIKPGQSYLSLHEQMHQSIGHILSDAGIVNVSGEQAYDDKLTQAFLPHGLGHLLGLQTHDVAGQQVTADGATKPPPEDYAALRLTRTVEVGQVFTIEPGIYFIPMLQAELATRGKSKLLNTGAIQELLPFGGMRIEDNVVVGIDGIENLTRHAFDKNPLGIRA